MNVNAIANIVIGILLGLALWYLVFGPLALGR